MTAATKIHSWRDIRLHDLFYAYRKAKADCYYERCLHASLSFAAYEENVVSNLRNLQKDLHRGSVAELFRENLGLIQISAKKLRTAPQDASTYQDTSTHHGFFSDPLRALDHLAATSKLFPEFRVVGDFPVTMHILSALWINLVGHKYDATLRRSACAARLRRLRRHQQSQEASAPYHLEALGSFEPYFEPYRAWRSRGLQTIRDELQAGRAVIALSLDLQSYYHRIDASFATNSDFLSRTGIELTNWELEFTHELKNALLAWDKMACVTVREFGGQDVRGGLPIGLSATRILANCLLFELDHDIEHNLSPLYYGRYVDDIFLVLRDPGGLKNAAAVFRYIGSKTECFPEEQTDDGNVRLSLPGEYQGHTELALHAGKQKSFFLAGRSGLDFLSNLESQIQSLSSERRLLPNPDELDHTVSARVLTAAGQAANEADSIAKADGLSVRRLSWSVQLRSVETLEAALPSSEWKAERHRFYEFACAHILRADRILDHIDYIHRLLGLAVAMSDWDDVELLVNSAFGAIDTLRKKTQANEVFVNGAKCANDERTKSTVWTHFTESTCGSIKEAILRAVPWTAGKPVAIPVRLARILTQYNMDLLADDVSMIAVRLRESDLSRTSYKEHLRSDARKERKLIREESVLLEEYTHSSALKEFLSKPNDRNAPRTRTKAPPGSGSVVPFLFPTRPYTSQEIALYVPAECIFANDRANAWSKYVSAVRGTWPRIVHSFKKASSSLQFVQIGESKVPDIVLLGISSLETSELSWSHTANGTSDISRERYARIRSVVNQAVRAKPKPNYLLLPELSVPERWIGTLSRTLLDANINMVAGLDYSHPKKKQVTSSAVLVLSDDTLGYPASVQIRQNKSLPAPSEEETLLRDFGKKWAKDNNSSKPLYLHNGFSFGVLICSELQNMSYRRTFQGHVDSLMILSWNKDIETFSSLVEAASLDVHAYIALVNNRLYGDSRVRAPAKEAFLRDVCRLRGGQNDHLVVAKVNVKGLREFQSRAKRWPQKTDPFKPVPEGYRLWSQRRTIPK